jgi:hypothetical protein
MTGAKKQGLVRFLPLGRCRKGFNELFSSLFKIRYSVFIILVRMAFPAGRAIRSYCTGISHKAGPKDSFGVSAPIPNAERWQTNAVIGKTTHQ